MVTTMLVNDIPKEPGQRREWIKYQLRLKGYSLAKLSLEYGTYRDAVVQALKVPVPKWEKIVAATLGLRPQDLWPERYREDGRPNRHSPRYPLDDTKNNRFRQRTRNKADLT